MLTIHNRHSAACGIPPIFSTEAANLGYFENRHGEQWIFHLQSRDARGEPPGRGRRLGQRAPGA